MFKHVFSSSCKVSLHKSRNKKTNMLRSKFNERRSSSMIIKNGPKSVIHVVQLSQQQ